jgi:integrase
MQRPRSLRVNRIFAGVGRINIVSGATTKVEHDARNALLTKLYKLGMLDHLRALRRGELTLTELYADDMEGRLEYSLNRTTLQRPLWQLVNEWIPNSALAPASRRRYRQAWDFVKRTGVLRDGATVNDLGAVDWRALCNRGLIGPTGWNRARSAVSSFLSAVLRDVWHEFRRRIMARFPKPEEPERVTELAVGEFWTILEHVVPALRPAFVTITAAGLGPAEFVRCTSEDLLPATRGLVVHGRKLGRQGDAIVRLSVEAFEWARAAIPCPVGASFLSHTWKKACRAAGRGDVRLYDLRHCYAQWLSAAGAPEAAIQVGMRHRSASMTRRYTRARDMGENASLLGRVMFPAAPERKQLAAGAD